MLSPPWREMSLQIFLGLQWGYVQINPPLSQEFNTLNPSNTYISLQLDKVIQRKAYFINEVLNISEDTEYCTESEEQND